MFSVLVGTSGLTAAAIAALYVTLTRQSPPESKAARHKAARALGLAVVVQTVHFVEEAVTGFHERFPELLALSAWPLSYFVIFNVTWLAIWAASISGLRSGWRVAFFASWFLAIAGIMNGVAHPVFAIAARGYFPGLISSPLICVAGALLWVRLRRATATGVRE